MGEEYSCKKLISERSLLGYSNRLDLYAIAKSDVSAAKHLAKEYIDDLLAGDYRKGPQFGAPRECYNADTAQNSVYLTPVSCPYIVFKRK